MIILLVLLVLAFWLGSRWQYHLMIRTMTYHPNRIRTALDRIEKLNNTDEDLGIEITVEKVDNLYLLYDTNTNTFLAQGTSLEHALKELALRFPDKNFFGSEIISSED